MDIAQMGEGPEEPDRNLQTRRTGGHKFVEMRLPRLAPAISLPPSDAYAHGEPITLQHGPWRVTVPRNVARQDLEQVIRALEAADAV